MVRHLVMWKLKEGYSAEEKAAILQGMKEGLEGMVGSIPGLLSAKVYTDLMPSSTVDVMLECELESYDTESGWMVGRILNVAADEGVLGENGKPDWRKLRPVTYDSPGHGYVVLGEKVADAYQAGSVYM